ncbi:MAG: hypothetical protein AAF327_08445 [Cyanobacteria bacterium P01_A01_bin.37]
MDELHDLALWLLGDRPIAFSGVVTRAAILNPLQTTRVVSL